MRIDYSERALSDLASIHDFLASEWPGVGEKFDSRLSEIERRILTFPTGAVAVEDRPGVFVVPFINFPIVCSTRSRTTPPWLSTSETPCAARGTIEARAPKSADGSNRSLPLPGSRTIPPASLTATLRRADRPIPDLCPDHFPWRGADMCFFNTTRAADSASDRNTSIARGCAHPRISTTRNGGIYTAGLDFD